MPSSPGRGPAANRPAAEPGARRRRAGPGTGHSVSLRRERIHPAEPREALGLRSHAHHPPRVSPRRGPGYVWLAVPGTGNPFPAEGNAMGFPCLMSSRQRLQPLRLVCRTGSRWLGLGLRRHGGSCLLLREGWHLRTKSIKQTFQHAGESLRINANIGRIRLQNWRGR